jgi:predicted XRE-type DNA-binding protein
MYFLWYIQKITMAKKSMGSSIDDFFKKENIFEEAQAQAVKEVVAWELAKAMKKKKISKARMAVLLKTSRSQVDRILDPKRDITLGSLQRAAALVGQRVVIELVVQVERPPKRSSHAGTLARVD